MILVAQSFSASREHSTGVVQCQRTVRSCYFMVPKQQCSKGIMKFTRRTVPLRPALTFSGFVFCPYNEFVCFV
jgi:hypothetical protein